ncbi:MAG: HAMP domain-containing histidine kinase [Novosphingobium sp.]|nr:HAMP domain-containing histidine kinase [Novosphingobium sp.]
MGQLVAAIFLLQVTSSWAAIFLLNNNATAIVRTDRIRRVHDVRDVLLDAYYDGGREELAHVIERDRGNAADPLVFVALAGHGPAVMSNLAEVPPVAPGGPYRVHLRHLPAGPGIDGIAEATDLADGSRLIVGAWAITERRYTLAFAEALGLTLALSVLMALLSATVLGYIISRRTHAIAETAEALAAGDFAARIGSKYSGDGFDHVRSRVNLMAERIDRLVRQLRSVAGELAHDLQSPVSRLTAAIDTAVASTSEPRVLAALQGARADAESLETMLANALELSRLESGTIADRRELLDLAAVAGDLAELYEPLAEQSGVTLATELEPVRTHADRELLSRAIANLVDNALKYGGDRIVIATRQVGGRAEITVSDNGPGIADGDRARAIRRFARLDNARTRPGAGLGLAMVAAVAELQEGALILAGEAGLEATLSLPATPGY